MPKYNISPNKIYTVPDKTTIVHYNNYIIVVAPMFANWIVLSSELQLDVFRFFASGHSIEETLTQFSAHKEEVAAVVIQLEAKNFCNKVVHDASEDERSLHFYLTNKCNLRCPHCFMFSGEENINELTTEEIIKCITDYRNIAKGKTIALSGGEPTLHKDFELIVQTAYNLGLNVTLLTNGTIIEPSKVSFLSKYITSVQISIDGFSEATNASIRGKGNYERALRLVDTCLKNNIETSIAITPPLEVFDKHVDDYVQFVTKLKEQYHNQPIHINIAEEILKGRSIEPSKEYLEKYVPLAQRVLKAIYGDKYDIVSFVDRFQNGSILDNCMFGHFAIASNGNVYFCSRISDLPAIANVRTNSMEEIYDKALLAEQASHISNLRPCNECDLIYICGGGCRIEHFPELTNITSFEECTNSVFRRFCSPKLKEHFYDLMVRSNEYLYSEETAK